MSQDDILLVDVEVEEYAITVAPTPSTSLIVRDNPEVIIMAAGGLGLQGEEGPQGPTGPAGPQGPVGPVAPAGIADREFPVWDTASGTWVRSTSGLVKVASSGILFTDVTLLRSAANVLKSSAHFRAGLDLYAQDGGATQIRIGNNSGNPSIDFGSAMDVSLYRAFASVLQTNGEIRSQRAGAGSAAFGAYVVGDVAERFYMSAAGVMNWGSGAVAPDTNLYRWAAAVLATQSRLLLQGDRLAFGAVGASGDAFITRIAANILRAENTLVAIGNMWAQSTDTTPTNANVGVGAMGPSGQAGIKLGSDVNLYRGAADGLYTDDSLVFAPNSLRGAFWLDLSGGYGGIYRVSADGRLHVRAQTDLVLRPNAANQIFISDDAGNLDVNLKRGGADILKTDDSFVASAIALGGGTPPAAGGIKFGDGTIQTSAVLSGVDYIGNYDPAVAYKRGDVVRYNGVDYMAVNPSTGQTPPASNSIIPTYGPTFPTSPHDGQEHIWTDSLTDPTFSWRLRYNASATSAWKWEFVGGAPKYVGQLGNLTAVAPTAYTALTGGPSFTLPRAGRYIFKYGGFMQNQNGSTNVYEIYGILRVNGTGIGAAVKHLTANIFSGGTHASEAEADYNGGTIDIGCAVQASGLQQPSSWLDWWIEVIPRRVA